MDATTPEGATPTPEEREQEQTGNPQIEDITREMQFYQAVGIEGHWTADMPMGRAQLDADGTLDLPPAHKDRLMARYRAESLSNALGSQKMAEAQGTTIPEDLLGPLNAAVDIYVGDDAKFQKDLAAAESVGNHTTRDLIEEVRKRREALGQDGGRSEGSAPKLDLDQYVNPDILKGVKINWEYLEKQSGPASEKVARYFGDRLKGIDGQPLPDAAAKLAVDSLAAERDARTQEILLKLAGSPAETAAASEIQSIALDTMFLGMVVDSDAAYRNTTDKLLRYTHKNTPNPTDLINGDATAMAKMVDELTMARETRISSYDPEEMRKRLIQALEEMYASNALTNTEGFGKIFEDNKLGTLNQSDEDQTAQDQVRDALATEGKPDEPTEPTPPTIPNS